MSASQAEAGIDSGNRKTERLKRTYRAIRLFLRQRQLIQYLLPIPGKAHASSIHRASLTDSLHASLRSSIQYVVATRDVVVMYDTPVELVRVRDCPNMDDSVERSSSVEHPVDITDGRVINLKVVLGCRWVFADGLGVERAFVAGGDGMASIEEIGHGVAANTTGRPGEEDMHCGA